MQNHKATLSAGDRSSLVAQLSDRTEASPSKPRQGGSGKMPNRALQYWALTKPGVTQLAVFCTLIGIFLATDGLPGWHTLIATTIGVWLMAGAAFASNCLIEAEVDARMARTARRATAMGELRRAEVITFSAFIGGAGALILYTQVNPLTMWLTLATFVGYAFIYTIYLKPNTSQNIVIGGLAGAMPPALGWAAAANEVPMQAWLLVLIIFMWTPPHFWALAMYRREDYKRSGLPMLPVTHGLEYTGRQVWLYSLGLAAVTVLPWATGMSGLLYLGATIVLDIVFLRHSWLVYKRYSDQVARKAFAWSIVYLSLLFAVLLLDHYFKI
jgi:protoheme IX farnesyltransferase